MPKILPNPPSNIKSPPPIPSLDLKYLNTALIIHNDKNPAKAPSNDSCGDVNKSKHIFAESPIKIKLIFK